MNDRERFIRTMQFQSADRFPYHELGLWGHTVDRYLKEGMPEAATKENFFYGSKFFGLDRRDFIPIAVGMVPGFEPRVYHEDERVIVMRDGAGIVRKAMKEGAVRGTRPSMDQHIQFPVESPMDFQAMKLRHDPTLPARYPRNWGDLVKRWSNRDYPLCLLTNATFGFYSTPRHWMGTEGLSLAFYDQPKMMHEMMDFLADFFIEVTRKALREVQIDYFNFFEDMAYKTAPLVSPKTFREFMLPRYKRVVAHLKKHGVQIITLDTDGNCEPLIPLYIEAGVTGIWPCEIAANMDPVRLRKEYGKDLVLMGGIDKRELAKGKKEVEAEVRRRILPLLDSGGYIPHVDHTVPPDVPFENFMYFLDLKRKCANDKT
jgi:uroporphyrinogen decarboxylase